MDIVGIVFELRMIVSNGLLKNFVINDGMMF